MEKLLLFLQISKYKSEILEVKDERGMLENYLFIKIDQKNI